MKRKVANCSKLGQQRCAILDHFFVLLGKSEETLQCKFQKLDVLLINKYISNLNLTREGQTKSSAERRMIWFCTRQCTRCHARSSSTVQTLDQRRKLPTLNSVFSWFSHFVRCESLLCCGAI